jgi:hypothetical protein
LIRATLLALVFTLTGCASVLPQYKDKLSQARVTSDIKVLGVYYKAIRAAPPVSAKVNPLTIGLETDAVDAIKARARLQDMVKAPDLRLHLQDTFIAHAAKTMPLPVSAETSGADTGIEVTVDALGMGMGSQPGRLTWTAAVSTRVVYLPEHKEVWSTRSIVEFPLGTPGPGGLQAANDMFQSTTFLDVPDDQTRAWVHAITAEAVRKGADAFVAALNKTQS